VQIRLHELEDEVDVSVVLRFEHVQQPVATQVQNTTGLGHGEPCREEPDVAARGGDPVHTQRLGILTVNIHSKMAESVPGNPNKASSVWSSEGWGCYGPNDVLVVVQLLKEHDLTKGSLHPQPRVREEIHTEAC
jgi:hypothetical protein